MFEDHLARGLLGPRARLVFGLARLPLIGSALLGIGVRNSPLYDRERCSAPSRPPVCFIALRDPPAPDPEHGLAELPEDLRA